MSCLLELEDSEVLKTAFLNIGDNCYFSWSPYRTRFSDIIVDKNITES